MAEIIPVFRGDEQVFPITSANAVMTETGLPYSSNLGDAWNKDIIYTVGQYCIYKNILWRCLIQNQGVEPTEGTYWTATSISKEVGRYKEKTYSGLTATGTIVSGSTIIGAYKQDMDLPEGLTKDNITNIVYISGSGMGLVIGVQFQDNGKIQINSLVGSKYTGGSATFRFYYH